MKESLADLIKVYTENGCLVVETPEAFTINVARIDGLTIPVNLHIGRNTVELPRGFYIVAGRKFIL